MTRSAATILLITLIAIVVGSFVVPVSSLILDWLQSFAAHAGPDQTIGARQLTLLWRGVWVTAVAACCTQLIGGGLAIGFQSSQRFARALAFAASVFAVLSPPFFYAYAWGLVALPSGVPLGDNVAHLLPNWLTREGRAILCLATWLAAPAAWMLAAGWRANGSDAYRLARIDSGAAAAFVRAGIPAMRRWILLSGLVTFAFAFTEYTICHLCLVNTWNVEVLAQLQALDKPALALAWPLLIPLFIACVVANPVVKHVRAHGLRRDPTNTNIESAAFSPMAGAARVWYVLSLLFVIAPVAIMTAEMQEYSAFRHIWSLYHDEWRGAAQLALLCGGLAIALALGVDLALGAKNRILRTFAWFAVAMSIGGAVLPAAVVGDGFLTAFEKMSPIRDSMLIVALLGVARFGVVAVLLVTWGTRTASANQFEAALADGARWSDAYFRILLPGRWREILAAGLCVGLLSAAEIGASQLIIPPAVPSLARTALNEIHFGRNDDVIAMLLSMAGIVGASAILLTMVRGRGEGVKG